MIAKMTGTVRGVERRVGNKVVVHLEVKSYPIDLADFQLTFPATEPETFAGLEPGVEVTLVLAVRPASVDSGPVLPLIKKIKKQLEKTPAPYPQAKCMSHMANDVCPKCCPNHGPEAGCYRCLPVDDK